MKSSRDINVNNVLTVFTTKYHYTMPYTSELSLPESIFTTQMTHDHPIRSIKRPLIQIPRFSRAFRFPFS